MALLAGTLAVRGSTLATQPATSGEPATVARVFALAWLGELRPIPIGPGHGPLAPAQLAGYAWLTTAFERHAGAVVAVREAVLAAAVVAGGLTWLLARRWGAGRPGAAALTLLVVLGPVVLGAGAAAGAGGFAACWLLAALPFTALARPGRLRAAGAGGCLLLAVATVPYALLAAPVIGWSLARHRPTGRTRATVIFTGAVAFAALAGAAVLLGTDLVPSRIAPGAGITPTEAVPLGLALGAALLAAGATRRPGGRIAPRRVATVPRLAVPWVALLVAAVVTVPLRAGDTSAAADRGARNAAVSWLAREASGPAGVLTDGATWAELVEAGWDPRTVTTPERCTDGCAGAWTLVTPALRAGLRDTGRAPGASRIGERIAVFGHGSGLVTVRHTAPQTDSVPARRVAGSALAASSRLAAPPRVRALLTSGRVGPRILTTLATLSVTDRVEVAALPPVAGEDRAGRARRQLLLAPSPQAPAGIGAFLAAQPERYQPAALIPTPRGVLVRYPPLAPSGLLAPFHPRHVELSEQKGSRP